MSWARLQGIIKRAVVDLTSSDGTKHQLLHSGDGVLPDVEYLEPQGLHFATPGAAQGLILCPGAQTSNAVSACLSGAVPSGDLAPGEGGLHYLGEWKVFLAKDGTVSFGDQVSADFVALASKVDAEIARIDQAITTLAAAVKPVAAATDSLTPGTGTTYNGATANLPGSSSSVASSVLRAK